MAQAIFCDMDGCKDYADILLTHLENGNVEAFCHSHFYEFIMNMAVKLLPEGEPPQPESEEVTVTVQAAEKAWQELEEEAAKEGENQESVALKEKLQRKKTHNLLPDPDPEAS